MKDSAKDWMFSLHEILAKDDFVRQVVTLWVIWRARRKAIHEDIFRSPTAVHDFINSYLRELSEIKVKPAPAPASTSPQQISHWISPAPGYATFNVDGAVSRHGFGYIGVISRDQEGTFLGASTFVFRFISDPPTLEALSIRKALALAKDLYIQNIEVASDCKIVVDDIHKRSSASYGVIVQEIIVFQFLLLNVISFMNVELQF
ncbi:Heat shock protein STI [Hordeum vulgare]|nr:Heat shock protein STI [Hordeum vulgare]